jgi:hypothetical protein
MSLTPEQLELLSPSERTFYLIGRETAVAEAPQTESAGQAQVQDDVPQTQAAAETTATEPDPFAEYSLEETEEYNKSIAADLALDQEIRHFEAVNAELFEAVDDPNFVLPVVPENCSKTEKCKTLHDINRILVEKMNLQDSEEEQPEPEPVVAVPLRIGKNKTVWVDSTGKDVDTGQQYNLAPETQKFVKDKLEQRLTDLANQVVEEKEVQPHSRYAMTEEDFERESEKEFPVYILPKQPGPAWDDSILYGPAGELIRKASQFNESHPAGMLVDLLVSIGSIIGRGPYFTISSTQHYTNEFMARVGDSSKSRKGTGRDVIDAVVKLVDSNWYSNRIASGFGSGEAIVNQVRDPIVEKKLNHRTGTWDTLTTPGIDDKRLCIREGELASVFVLAGKPESRADLVIRDAWDSKPLRNLVKGKSRDGLSNSAKCEEPHISISGDTTISELRQKMPTGAYDNGFGNRFIYVYVYRVKDCPQGSPPLDWAQETLYFHKVIQFAKNVKHVSMSKQARDWWNYHYSELEHNGPGGLAGKMTTRAAAHLRRLAMLYALIDLSDRIELKHFQAAEKLWRYCEESAMFIFSGVTKEQLRIVQWVAVRGPVTFKQIREDMYQRNRSAADIKADVDSLVKTGHLFFHNGMYTTGQHVGKLITT